MTTNGISPVQPQENECLYTEGIDYALTGNDSIWGKEDDLTKKALTTEPVNGLWLNLCAGDGRFNEDLLRQADHVVAVDADPGALDKLVRVTPDELKSKMEIKVCDATKALPFNDASFNGIFCAGTLHLFPEEIFLKIIAELNRVLKPGGMMILDYATDIRRVKTDGSLYTVEKEPLFTLDQAVDFLKKSLSEFKVEIQTDTCEPEEVDVRGEKYSFSCNYILLVIKKPTIVSL